MQLQGCHRCLLERLLDFVGLQVSSSLSSSSDRPFNQHLAQVSSQTLQQRKTAICHEQLATSDMNMVHKRSAQVMTQLQYA